MTAIAAVVMRAQPGRMPESTYKINAASPVNITRSDHTGPSNDPATAMVTNPRIGVAHNHREPRTVGAVEGDDVPVESGTPSEPVTTPSWHGGLFGSVATA